MGNASNAPLHYGRGSDWGFLLLHFYVVHPAAALLPPNSQLLPYPRAC
jgi:hypothetical protein